MPTANGSTVILPDGAVELTTGLHDQVGSAFDTQPLPTTESFQLHFSYDLRQNDTIPQADGFGFVIQNAAPSAEGTSGGQLGFGGLPGQSVGILTRSWTNDLLQISTNSDIRASAALAVAPYPVGQLTEATGTEDISYDAITHLLSVTATPAANQGSPVTLSTTIDLAASLGPTAWFGFIGATGTGDSIQTMGAASLQEGTATITGFPGEPTVPCYAAGTRVLSDHGEVAVEDLVIGERLVTASGAARPIRWIGRRDYSGRFAAGNRTVLPILIRAGALADGVPYRDLRVSPKHAMFLDGMLIPAEHLINGVSVVQIEMMQEIAYFHIELDAHDVIQAEGALSETYVDDDNRGMFHNAHEFHALHPDAHPTPARYFATRVEDGYELEAVRRRIDVRAGIRQQDASPASATLRGSLDYVGLDLVNGWAQNSDHPEAPVCVDVFDNGVLIARALANRYRADLKKAALGSGRHSFEVRFPLGLCPLSRHIIQVCRSSDGTALGSARVMEPSESGIESTQRSA